MQIKRDVGYSFAIGLTIVALQHIGGAYHSGMAAFNNTVAGRALTTIAVSGLIIQSARQLLSVLSKSSKVSRLLGEFRRASATNQLGNPEHRREFIKATTGTTLSRSYVDNVSADEAAVMILGLQEFSDVVPAAPDFDVFEFTRLSEKAASSPGYQEILLQSALMKSLFGPDEAVSLATHLIQKKAGTIHVSQQTQDADHKLFERLNRARSETVYIFSTTSQVSNLSVDLMTQQAERLAAVKFLLVSPLIESDTALIELRTEHDVPPREAQGTVH